MTPIRSRSQAPLQFVKSAYIASRYPAITIRRDDDELAGTLQFIEQLFPDKAIIICQRASTPSVQYASPNCKKVFGLEAREVMDMLLPDFLTRVHPDDIQEVHQCFACINALEPYDPLLYRFELHYRVKHKAGHYVHIADEKMTMKSASGKYIYLNLFSDVTAGEKLFDVKMNIYHNIRGDFKRIQTYTPRLSQSHFTPRQKDIVNLISKGFTNSEIARALSVSVHTVKNHKSLLFRKINVKSAVELMGALGERG